MHLGYVFQCRLQVGRVGSSDLSSVWTPKPGFPIGAVLLACSWHVIKKAQSGPLLLKPHATEPLFIFLGGSIGPKTRVCRNRQWWCTYVLTVYFHSLSRHRDTPCCEAGRFDQPCFVVFAASRARCTLVCKNAIYTSELLPIPRGYRCTVDDENNTR